MSSVTCQSCGHIDKYASRFCPSCGAKLAVDNDENTDAFEIVEVIPHEYDRAQFPESCGLFVIESGPKAGARYGLEDELITIGRHTNAGIFLDDITVSRRHAQVERVGDRYTVKDVGSLNGTYVNRERIDSAELREGDEVQIGRFRLVFFYGTGS